MKLSTKMNKVTSVLYKSAFIMNDIKAVVRAIETKSYKPIARRIYNKIIVKTSSKLLK